MDYVVQYSRNGLAFFTMARLVLSPVQCKVRTFDTFSATCILRIGFIEIRIVDKYFHRTQTCIINKFFLPFAQLSHNTRLNVGHSKLISYDEKKLVCFLFPSLTFNFRCLNLSLTQTRFRTCGWIKNRTETLI